MKLKSTGYEIGMPATAIGGHSEGEGKRILYPEIRLQGDDMPKIPEGESYAVVKIKKVGYRDPAEEDAEKTCEVAILAMATVPEGKAKSLAGDDEYEDDEDSDDLPNFSKNVMRSIAKRVASERRNWRLTP
jgi:hypothetical protein